MASERLESIQFYLEWDNCDDEFLEDIDFNLVKSLMEKKIFNLQEDVSVSENTTSALTAVENMMLRGDPKSITNLYSDYVPQTQCESSRVLPSSSFDIAKVVSENKNKNTELKISILFTYWRFLAYSDIHLYTAY